MVLNQVLDLELPGHFVKADGPRQRAAQEPRIESAALCLLDQIQLKEQGNIASLPSEGVPVCTCCGAARLLASRICIKLRPLTYWICMRQMLEWLKS